MYGNNANSAIHTDHRGATGTDVPRSVQEKAIGDTLNEAMGYIEEALNTQTQIRDRICGGMPLPSADNSPQEDPTRSVEAMARYICSHTAMLAGEAKSLLARL